MKLRSGHKSQILKLNKGFQNQAGFQALLHWVLSYSKSGYNCLGFKTHEYFYHNKEGF